jgi:hypothetical protein
MNERIKETADFAAQYAATAALPTGKSGDDLFVEKFSELIIQDCMGLCALVALAALEKRDGANDLYSHGREDAAALCKSAIQKHFGEGK